MDSPRPSTSEVRAPNVLVHGALDDLNLKCLQRVPGVDNLSDHQLLSNYELQHGDGIPTDDLIEKAASELEASDSPVDAVVGY